MYINREIELAELERILIQESKEWETQRNYFLGEK